MIELSSFDVLNSVSIRYAKIVKMLRDDDRKTVLVTIQKGYLENGAFMPATMLARRQGRFKVQLDDITGEGAEYDGTHFSELLLMSTTKEDFRISDVEDKLLALGIVSGSRVV